MVFKKDRTNSDAAWIARSSREGVLGHDERLLAEIRLLRTIIDQATEDRREIVRNARVNMDALNAENNLLRAAATALCEAVEAYDGYLARGQKGLVASMTSDMFRANAALRDALDRN